MQEVHPVKFEVNLLPNAVKKIESIASMTGTSKSEVVEKMLLEYVPFEEDRALQWGVGGDVPGCRWGRARNCTF